MNVKIIKKCTVIGIILFFMFILLTGWSKEEKKSNLIGMWDSDWQPVVDRNIYIFNEDGTGENIFILEENIENNNDIKYLESKAEIVMKFKYKDYGTYVELEYDDYNEKQKIDYEIKDNILSIHIKQAGWTDREYNKL